MPKWPCCTFAFQACGRIYIYIYIYIYMVDSHNFCPLKFDFFSKINYFTEVSNLFLIKIYILKEQNPYSGRFFLTLLPCNTTIYFISYILQLFWSWIKIQFTKLFKYKSLIFFLWLVLYYPFNIMCRTTHKFIACSNRKYSFL